ncbi:unnamed protein product [Leptosia nina]|uniref:Uncharacterized protein n=1 Tax=Leptosia nina TaxID=320188 RepID=A0AAV1ITM2_9NEOP
MLKLPHIWVRGNIYFWYVVIKQRWDSLETIVLTRSSSVQITTSIRAIVDREPPLALNPAHNSTSDILALKAEKYDRIE